MSFHNSTSQHISSGLSIILIALLAFLISLIIISRAQSLISEVENSSCILKEDVLEEYL